MPAKKSVVGDYDKFVRKACKQAGINFPLKEWWLMKERGMPLKHEEGYPRHWYTDKQAERRRWRLDYYWPDLNIGVEIDGIMPWGRMGGHQTPSGFSADCQKHNLINIQGILLLRYTPNQLKSGQLAEELAWMRENGQLASALPVDTSPSRRP